MQVIMNQYLLFITVWCLALNTYIVFSSGYVKALEKKEQRRMEKIIYFIIVAMMFCDLDSYMFISNNTKWAYWNLNIVRYALYWLKFLYLTAFTIFITKEGRRFVRAKKVLLMVSVLIGIIGMGCTILPGIMEKAGYFECGNYSSYIGIYDTIRALVILDILVLLTVLLLGKDQYRKKTLCLYLGYVFILAFTAILDYVIDTWYMQNVAIFFSSMIIFIDNMTQVSDQWLDVKKELLISEYKASHDIMTGLWNKTSGLDRIREYLKEMSENDMAVLGFIDIDNFKAVNDTYGHETGDLWIRDIASVLHEMCRTEDVVCRYGGDEFIIFLRNIRNIDELTARVNEFQKKVHDKAAEREQDVHCSIGLYQVKGGGRKLAECIIKADGLLYQAKENGKDTYVIG